MAGEGGAQLRKKVERDAAKPRYLISEPWVGYRLSTEPAEPSATNNAR